MKPLRCIGFVFVCGLALGSEVAAAQGQTTLAVDATLGAGTGNGGEFFDRDLIGVRLAASLRRSGPTRVGFFGEIALDALSLTSAHAAVCYPNPRGGCLDSYPELWGPTLTGGLLIRSTDQIEARLGVGGGAFVADGTRVGAAVIQADVAFFPVRHIGAIAGARWVAVPRYRGDRLSILPWAIGLRLR